MIVVVASFSLAALVLEAVAQINESLPFGGQEVALSVEEAALPGQDGALYGPDAAQDLVLEALDGVHLVLPDGPQVEPLPSTAMRCTALYSIRRCVQYQALCTVPGAVYSTYRYERTVPTVVFSAHCYVQNLLLCPVLTFVYSNYLLCTVLTVAYGTCCYVQCLLLCIVFTVVYSTYCCLYLLLLFTYFTVVYSTYCCIFVFSAVTDMSRAKML